MGAGARVPVGIGVVHIPAAEGGHLAVLRWAREHDCPWDKSVCEYISWKHPDTQARMGAAAARVAVLPPSQTHKTPTRRHQMTRLRAGLGCGAVSAGARIPAPSLLTSVPAARPSNAMRGPKYIV